MKKTISFKQIKQIIEFSKLFDKNYYLKHYTEARLAKETPLEHYCKIGLKENKKPNKNFDPVWYNEYYKDVKGNGVYPIIHYILFGINENRLINKKEKNNYEIIKNSGLFDEEFYKKENKDLNKQNKKFDYLLHYIRFGLNENKNPNKKFDSAWYNEYYADVRTDNALPFIHYILFGMNENRFINKEEKNNYEIIKNSGLFDEEFYKKENKDLNKQNKNFDYLLDYIRFGLNENKNPNKNFDSAWYNKYYADVKTDNAPPFIHYISFGINENRLINKEENNNYEIIKNSGLFDEEFYKKENKDLNKQNNDFDYLLHYVRFGLNENRKPNKDFDPVWYKEYYKYNSNDDNQAFIYYINFEINENKFINKKEFEDYTIIKQSGLFDIEFYRNNYPELQKQNKKFDCILHYLRTPKDEGINPLRKNIEIDQVLNKDEIIRKENLIINSNLFDTNYYFNQFNKDNIISSDQAIKHYLLYGWHKAYNPNKWFDINKYLSLNTDILNAKIEPFSHYIEFGQYENRPLKKYVYEEVTEEKKYIDYKEHDIAEFKTKVIAFYLPQFHPFKENDNWWGKGFTEWTNVTKAKPNFDNHYQPHLPIHLGFYDLRLPEVMIEQAKLAKNYGINGFNFYYYWFDGKVLMETPFDILLKHKEINIDFCITWANENWTRKWDGLENDVLIAQNHTIEDSILFIKSLFKYFKDDRYIRINNRPVLIIYRMDIIPDIKEIIKLWRKEVRKAGFDGLYLITCQSFNEASPIEYGFDAAMEFPPHKILAKPINNEINIINKEYRGNIYNYSEVISNKKLTLEPKYKLFRTSMLSWDNTARNQNNSNIFHNFSLLKYQEWLANNISNVLLNDKYCNDEKIVFVNAWNEWAEGTHLEPDTKYGYGYLESTHNALLNVETKLFKNNKVFDIVILATSNNNKSIENLLKHIKWFKQRTFLNIGIVFDSNFKRSFEFKRLLPVYFITDFPNNNIIELKKKFNNKIKSIYIHDLTNEIVIRDISKLSVPVIMNIDCYEKNKIIKNVKFICTKRNKKFNNNVKLIKTELFELSLLELLYQHTELKPKVSIIVPSYNHEHFLKKRINSILNQTFQDFELILLDDDSKDNSKNIIKEFSKKRPSILTHFNKKNSGTPFNQWALGIKKSRAEIIWIAEDDDFCENIFLEKLVPLFNNERLKLAYSNSYLIDENDNSIGDYNNIFSKVSENKWQNDYINHSFKEIQTALGIRNTIPNASAVLFKKFDIEIILNQLTQFKFAGDWFFYLNAISSGDISFTKEKLNYHRRHKTSTMSLLKDDIKLYFNEIEFIHNYIKSTFILNKGTINGMIQYIEDEWLSKRRNDDINKYYNLEKLKINKNKFKKSQNIAVFFSGYYFGGAEIFPINLANSFAELGHNIYLFNVGALETDKRVKNMVSSLVKQVGIINNKNTKEDLKNFLINNNIEIINSQGWFATDYIQKNINKLIIPWFASMHGHEESIINGDWGDDYLKYFNNAIINTINKSPIFIYTHKKNLEVFKHYKLNADCKTINLPTLGMPNYLPESNLRSELNIEQDSFVIGFVARGIEEKGWIEVIQSAIILNDKYRIKTNLVLIGDSSFVQALKKKYSSLVYIHFLGLSDEVLQWSQIFDVSLLPSFYKSESHPLVIMGYLLCYSPVITTSLGNISEMIDYKNEKAGYLLSFNKQGKPDPNDIARIIKKYIDKPSLFNKHKDLARKAFRKFDMQVAANKYIDTFNANKSYLKKNNKKSLYIHVGIPKTGTSAIQDFLLENSDILKEKHDLYYPNFEKSVDNSHHKIGVSLINNSYAEIKTHNEQLLYLDKLEEDISKSHCNNILLCSEYFHVNDNFINKFVEKYNIKIICYLKRQDYYIESLYRQQVQDVVYNERRTFNEYIKTVNNDHLYYYSLLNRWNAITSKTNFIIKIYDKSKFYNNNLIDDFLNLLKINYQKGDLNINKNKVNHNFTPNVIKYKILLNRVCNNQEKQLVYYLKLYSDFERKTEGIEEKSSYFNRETRINFLKQFEDDNKKVIDTYNLQLSSLFDNKISNEEYVETILNTEKILEITKFIYSINKEIIHQIYDSCLKNTSNKESIIKAVLLLKPIIKKIINNE